MALETYTGYIPALVTANPTPTDPVSEGDNHVRGVKQTLKTTFSGFTEEDVAVTVKASDINAVCAGGVASALPAGMIAAFGMESVPDGWLLCDGSIIGRSVYPALFAAIGTIWGDGNGTTTFEVPNFRGQFLRMYNDAQEFQPNYPSNVGDQQSSLNNAHVHTIAEDTHTHTAQQGGAHTHPFFLYVPDTDNTVEGGSGKSGMTLDAGATGNATPTTHTHVIESNTHNHGMFESGGEESRPVNYSIAYCIKT